MVQFETPPTLAELGAVLNQLFDIVTEKFEGAQLVKARVPKLTTAGGSTNVDNSLHPSNAYVPILVTQSSIRKSFNEEQYLNALAPMLVTKDGIIIDFKFAHPLNVPALICVMLRDIRIYVKPEQF
jgi:hypothetical protein